jgi:hypothetical protein
MTFSEDKDSRRPVWFELVKSSGNYGEPAPFSDPIHDVLEVFGTCDPYTIDVTQEVAEVHRTFAESLHSTLRVLDFIYD